MREWFALFEEVAALNGLSEKMKNRKLIHFLTGDAAEWLRGYRSNVSLSDDDWEDVKRGLIGFFEPSEDPQVLQSLIRQRKWDQVEPIQSYWMAKQRLIRQSKLSLTADEQIDVYLDGLPQYVKEAVPKQCESVQVAFEQVRRLVQLNQFASSSKANDVLNPEHSESNEKVDDQLTKVIKELDQANEKIEKLDGIVHDQAAVIDEMKKQQDELELKLKIFSDSVQQNITDIKNVNIQTKLQEFDVSRNEEKSKKEKNIERRSMSRHSKKWLEIIKSSDVWTMRKVRSTLDDMCLALGFSYPQLANGDEFRKYGLIERLKLIKLFEYTATLSDFHLPEFIEEAMDTLNG